VHRRSSAPRYVCRIEEPLPDGGRWRFRRRSGRFPETKEKGAAAGKNVARRQEMLCTSIPYTSSAFVCFRGLGSRRPRQVVVLATRALFVSVLRRPKISPGKDHRQACETRRINAKFRSAARAAPRQRRVVRCPRRRSSSSGVVEPSRLSSPLASWWLAVVGEEVVRVKPSWQGRS